GVPRPEETDDLVDHQLTDVEERDGLEGADEAEGQVRRRHRRARGPHEAEQAGEMAERAEPLAQRERPLLGPHPAAPARGRPVPRRSSEQRHRARSRPPARAVSRTPAPPRARPSRLARPPEGATRPKRARRRPCGLPLAPDPVRLSVRLLALVREVVVAPADLAVHVRLDLVVGRPGARAEPVEPVAEVLALLLEEVLRERAAGAERDRVHDAGLEHDDELLLEDVARAVREEVLQERDVLEDGDPLPEDRLLRRVQPADDGLLPVEEEDLRVDVVLVDLDAGGERAARALLHLHVEVDELRSEEHTSELQSREKLVC